jgi:hypothetical protein
MSALLELIVLLIFIFIWFRPVLKRKKEAGGYVDRKTEVIALIFGLIPATLVLLLCQFALGWVFKLTGISDHRMLVGALKAFVMFGAIEELTKYAFARLALKKYETLKKIDIMVIFGLVGMGYEITESMMLGNVFAGIARGIFVAHIMYQFIMGHFFYESIRAKNQGNDAVARRNRIFCFAIPMLIHGFNDYVIDLISVIMGETENAGVSGLASYAEMTNSQNIGIIVCVLVMILLNLFCLIWGLKLAKKDPEVEVTLK